MKMHLKTRLYNIDHMIEGSICCKYFNQNKITNSIFQENVSGIVTHVRVIDA